jgi:hypothetical protein
MSWDEADIVFTNLELLKTVHEGDVGRLKELVAALKRHVQNPETQGFSAVLIQAWGRTREE